MSGPNIAPGSPWINRFPGLRKNNSSRPGFFFEWDGKQHSAVRPELPMVADSKYYLEQPDLSQYSGTPSDEELDRMFRTEDYQRSIFKGMTTWELTSLNRWVHFSPDLPPMSGGHMAKDATTDSQEAAARIWKKYGLQVDESKWFSFLQRPKWYDWVSTSPPSEVEGVTWSLNDPAIWEALSPALELADRYLKALVDQKHPVVSYDSTDLGSPTWITNKSFWDSQGKSDGLTLGATNFWISAIVTLDTNRLPPLMSSGITIAERVRILHKLAGTIVHELAHALVCSRLFKYVPGSLQAHKNAQVDGFAEILVDFQGFAEAGISIEQAYFGGMLQAEVIGLPITSMSHEVPNGLVMADYLHVPGPWSEDGAVFQSNYIQSSYASRLLSEAWWQDPDLPPRSSGYFHKPFTFTSQARTGELEWDKPEAHEPDVSDLYHGANMRDFTTWSLRAKFRDEFRQGWHASEFAYWLNSPWRALIYMLLNSDFAKPFAEKDEVVCAQLAERLVRGTLIWTDEEQFYSRLPQHEYDLQSAWIHHCIGLLMMASLPIRRVEKQKAFLNATVHYRLVPGSEAIARGVVKEPVFLIMDTAKKPTIKVDKSRFYDHINHRGEVEDGFTQFDYLQNAMDIVKLVSSSTICFLPWVRAIVSAHDALLHDRQQIRRENGNTHTDYWATQWFFKVPPYQKYMGRVENGVPREMRPNPTTGKFEYVDDAK
ncbi:hypothetical protein O1611_g1289 [Lasiodiplodia mahajangana]|uniref:Uncharacterized protein n=1 Tax=Lasiodiplodia mahajangana TaxID=1108764 RepID=A0ACC2JXV9_9PEZI|nr:hypothetical protein O1611_g1289 [Lasiodiplodia mahajangana]